MAWKFNPFTGALDQTGSKPDSYIDGEVATYNDLPLSSTTAPLNAAWLVRGSSGVWPFTKPGGVYIRTATGGSSRDADYTYAGVFPDVFSDANFTLYDDGDSTKNAKFQLSGISAGTTRTLTVPNASGTITLDGHTHIFYSEIVDSLLDGGAQILADIGAAASSHAHDAANITSGTLANARVNWAAPSGIGSTTAAAGAFTTLSASSTVSGTGFSNYLASPPAIGGTAANSGAFTTLTANNGTLTASAPVLDLSQTWNNAAVTFTGLKFNVTNTASNAASNVIDIQVGGTTRMMLKRDGVLHLQPYTNSGLYHAAPAWIGSTAGLMCSTNLSIGNILDTILERGGAGIIEQRNGTNAQTFRLYNTFTDANNHERGFMRWSSNVLQVGTEKAGTGSARALELQTDGTTRLTIGTSGNAAFSGNLTVGGSTVPFYYPGGLWAGVNGNFAVAGTLSLNNSLNAFITADAANIIAIRNGGNGQAFRIYNTSNSSTNFERLNVRWASNECIIDAEAGSGGGTLRGIKIGSATSSLLGFYGATPVDRPDTVSDAATQDLTGSDTLDKTKVEADLTSCKTAINAVIDRLQELGLIA